MPSFWVSGAAEGQGSGAAEGQGPGADKRLTHSPVTLRLGNILSAQRAAPHRACTHRSCSQHFRSEVHQPALPQRVMNRLGAADVHEQVHILCSMEIFLMLAWRLSRVRTGAHRFSPGGFKMVSEMACLGSTSPACLTSPAWVYRFSMPHPPSIQASPRRHQGPPCSWRWRGG